MNAFGDRGNLSSTRLSSTGWTAWSSFDSWLCSRSSIGRGDTLLVWSWVVRAIVRHAAVTRRASKIWADDQSFRRMTPRSPRHHGHTFMNPPLTLLACFYI